MRQSMAACALGRRARFGAQTADIGPGWADAAVPFAWLLAAVALSGVAVVRRRPAFWLAPAALLAVTLLVNAETPRFRAPLDPFLILLAAYSVSSRGRFATRPSPEERPRRRLMSQGRK